MAALSKQTNFAVNTNKSQIYIEDSTTPLSYNYKTDQWSTITAYAGIGFYSVDSGVNIGLARVSGTAVNLQQPDTSDPAAEAIIQTGESTFNDGSRRIITGVRPLLTGGTANVSIRTRSTLNPEIRSNYLTRSEEVNDAAWTKTQLSVTANNIAAPDGETTADKVETTSGVNNTLTNISEDYGGTSSGIVLSCFFKNGDAGYVDFGVGVGTGTARMHVNLTDGSIVSVDSHASIQLYGVETHGNGWFRPWMVVTPEASTASMIIKLVDATETVSALGEYIYVWGGMIDVADSVGDYVVNSTDAVVVNDGFSTSTEATANSRSGIAPFRVESRYHRIKFRVNGGFTTILGADVIHEPTGEI